MTFSPDGIEMAVATTNGVTTIVRVADGKELGTITASPTKILFSADRQIVTLLGPDGTLRHNRTTQTTTTVAGAALAPGVIGVTFRRENGKLLVDALAPGGPAEESRKVRTGDELLAVAPRSGGRLESVLGSSVETAVQEIAGSAGSHVDLKLQRAGAASLAVVTLQRKAGRQINIQQGFAVPGGGPATESFALVARQGR
ncbi:MAG: hypothetical protein K1X57_07115 [Gemmataceae bacterium]|nr:hypothetical protein [Gemmataceae bacterium]